MFKLIAQSENARYGTIKTRHGTIETPCFMPVATKAIGKFIGPDDYKSINPEAIICNAFLLSVRPGIQVIEEAGGLHKFMGFNKPIITDSGGFQMLRSKLLAASTPKYLIFIEPYEKRRIKLMPEHLMCIQQALGSDIAMALDYVLPYTASKSDHINALKITHEWMKQQAQGYRARNQLIFGITQGGTFRELREESAKFINALDFDGIALGGLCIGEPKKKMFEMIDASLPFISEDKPRYLMGVGSPSDLLMCIEKGIDIFDSIYPTQLARHNKIFTSNGIIDIKKTKFKNSNKPLDEECECFVCKNFSMSFLHYLARLGDAMAKRYNSIHNLSFLTKLMKQARIAIKENRFSAFKAEFYKKFYKKYQT